MSCNSILFTAMTSPTTVAAGGDIPLGNVVRRYGCGATLRGNAISLNGEGYYDADVSVTVIPAAAGTITATLLQDSVAIPGATASATVAATDTSVTLSFPAAVRLLRYSPRATLRLTLSAAGSVTNAAVTVRKL
nr:MAG TPA: hypothetical protein [Bacteriophage sp.]